jgi:hypothetical protein
MTVVKARLHVRQAEPFDDLHDKDGEPDADPAWPKWIAAQSDHASPST